MTSATVASLLIDDHPTQEEIVRRLEAYPGIEPESVLGEAEARLEGVRQTGASPSSETVIWAVEAALDTISMAGQNGLPIAISSSDNAPPALSPGLRRDGSMVSVEAHPFGQGRASIIVSSQSTGERLLLDIAPLASLAARTRLVKALPEDVRAQTETLLEDLGAEIASINGSSHLRLALQGSELELGDVEPWPFPVSGADLLEGIVSTLRRFVVMSPDQAVTVAIWTIHTHVLEAADVSAILCISSPERRCGKTVLLGLVRRLVRRPLPASNISGAALFRTIEKHLPTMLLDEADSYLTESEQMRNLLNAGVRREDAFVYRVVGKEHEPRRFSVFGAKAISLIGALPATLNDRSIVLRLRRKLRTERVERLRAREALKVFGQLQQMAARWAEDHVDALRPMAPAIPGTLNDRAADFWEPLLAIADTIGGAWPDRARRAATTLSGDQEPSDDSPSILLLSDLREILKGKEGGRISSTNLMERLAALEVQPWATWNEGVSITQNQVARLLRRYDGVSPKTLRFSDGSRAKGYELESCQDAFNRYLPPSNDAGRKRELRQARVQP